MSLKINKSVLIGMILVTVSVAVVVYYFRESTGRSNVGLGAIPSKLDFGKLQPAESWGEVKKTVTLQNHKEESITLTKIKTSCSCTGSSPVKLPYVLKPGEKIDISISIKLAGLYGKRRELVAFIYGEDGISVPVDIEIESPVYTSPQKQVAKRFKHGDVVEPISYDVFVNYNDNTRFDAHQVPLVEFTNSDMLYQIAMVEDNKARGIATYRVTYAVEKLQEGRHLFSSRVIFPNGQMALTEHDVEVFDFFYIDNLNGVSWISKRESGYELSLWTKTVPKSIMYTYGNREMISGRESIVAERLDPLIYGNSYEIKTLIPQKFIRNVPAETMFIISLLAEDGLLYDIKSKRLN
jgi:hypothetical protein